MIMWTVMNLIHLLFKSPKGTGQGTDTIIIINIVLFFWTLRTVGAIVLSPSTSIRYSVAVAALCLMAGISMYAMFYSALSQNPHSFSVQPLTGVNAIYFSVVTFTTTGYGDITPLSTLPRIIASSEMLSGWLASAILMALLIYKITTRRDK